MLESIDADLARCLAIINSGAKILRYAKGFDSALKFYAHDDQAYFNASITLFTNIGEQANKLSSELKSKYIDIDWDLMIAFRNKIINNEISSNNFNKEDLNTLTNDKYYNYVDFSKFKS